MSIFSTVVCPRCAPGVGGRMQIWGHSKKISGALHRSLCPQLQNRFGAYALTYVTLKYENINS